MVEQMECLFEDDKEVVTVRNKCWGCDYYNPVATVEWVECSNPKRWVISDMETEPIERVRLFTLLQWNPETSYPIDNGCPFDEAVERNSEES